MPCHNLTRNAADLAGCSSAHINMIYIYIFKNHRWQGSLKYFPPKQWITIRQNFLNITIEYNRFVLFDSPPKWESKKIMTPGWIPDFPIFPHLIAWVSWTGHRLTIGLWATGDLSLLEAKGQKVGRKWDPKGAGSWYHGVYKLISCQFLGRKSKLS